MLHNLQKILSLVFALCILLSLVGCTGEETQVVPTETVALEVTEPAPTEPEPAEPAPTEPEVTEPEPAEPPEPVITEITLSFTGDCTFGRNQKQSYSGSYDQYYDKYGPDYFFSKVRDIFEADDITVINLEGSLTKSKDLQKKKWNHKGRPKYVKIMTGSSVEVATMGNNHRLDYGQSGCDETVKVLTENNITYCYDDIYAIYEVKGVKVGFVSVNEVYDETAVEVWLTEGYQYLRDQGCQIVVACPHWGGGHTSKIQEYQIDLGHRLIDMGYDLVVGNHPHRIQAIEYYNGKFIAYSLGNFSYGGNKNPDDKDSGIFQQTFTLVDGEVTVDMNAKFFPCSSSGKTSYNNYRPVVLQGEKAEKVMNRMNKYCAKFGLALDENGVPYLLEETT